MKRFLALVLALVLVLGLSACAFGGGTTAASASASTSLSPEEAANAAAAKTKDSFGIADIIKVPFGYLLDWLYEFTSNYGLALILFSLIIKLILYPLSVKSKKSMLKMSRVSPLVKALEVQYGDDKQKYQQAVTELYKEEGVSMTGGCVWSFIPLLIMLPLYYVIREPITYILHNARSVSAAVVAYIQASGINLGSSSYYHELAAAGHLGEFAEELKSIAVTANANLRSIDFSFLGVDLAGIPTWKFWECEGWSQIGLFLIPVLSGGFQMLSMFISQKMNNQVATNANGEKDEAAAKAANQSTMTMMIMMPIMSLWIGFSMPAAISIYWIAQAVFGTIQDYFLTIHYRKVYDAEDEVKQRIAAQKRAEEAERERQRALRREQNPDGIMDNVSKKKLKQQEKEAAAAAAKEFEAKKKTVSGEATDEDKPASGDPARPYARGRAYSARRYGESGEPASDEPAKETEE